MAEQGLGIACVPDFAVRRQIAEGTLVRVLADHMEFSGAFRAVWPSSRQVSPKLRAFIDFMAENLFAKPSARVGKTPDVAETAAAIARASTRVGRDRPPKRKAVG